MKGCSMRSRRNRYQKKQKRTQRNHRGGALSDVLPTTTWGSWASFPGALAWGANSQAPQPLANGGLYSGPQSTGEWASKPFPATQYAEAVESSKLNPEIPDVFYHQRPTDNTGASFSPYVGSPASSQHYSATAGPSMSGGRYRSRRHNKHNRNNRK